MISKKVEMLLNLVATTVAAEHQAADKVSWAEEKKYTPEEEWENAFLPSLKQFTIDGWEQDGYMVLDDIGVMLNELIEAKLK